MIPRACPRGVFCMEYKEYFIACVLKRANFDLGGLSTATVIEHSGMSGVIPVMSPATIEA